MTRRKIPRQFGFLAFGILQAGVTSAVAAAIACRRDLGTGEFFSHWFGSWTLAWLTMLPVVAFATPVLRRIVDRVLAADDDG